MSTFCGALLLVMGLSGWSINAAQSKELADIPLVQGDRWQQATINAKTAFIMGVGEVIEIEQLLMEKDPQLKRDSFVTKAAEGMAGMPVEKIVGAIDDYYTANPDKLEVPVLRVMWDTLIKPNIKTGIGGRPLD